MGFPDDYPDGGARGYYDNLHSGNPDLVSRADNYRWGHTDDASAPTIGPSPGVPVPLGGGGVVGEMMRETMRWPALIVWAAVFVAIHFLHWWNGLHTSGTQLNGITMLAIAAVVITSPTGRKLALGCFVLVILIVGGVALLSWRFAPHSTVTTESGYGSPVAAPQKGRAGAPAKMFRKKHAAASTN